MKKLIILFSILMILASASFVKAGELDNWDFYFFGINARDFEDREVLPVVVGCVASLAAHELGHIVAGNLMGMDTSFSWSDRVVYANNWDEASDGEQALFAGAGFISQLAIGTTLTLIPSTRHSDFTLGFNSFTMMTGVAYGVTGGLGDDNVSDVHNLSDNGYNGRIVAFITGGYAGTLSYINLNKDKGDLNDSSGMPYLQTTKYDRN